MTPPRGERHLCLWSWSIVAVVVRGFVASILCFAVVAAPAGASPGDLDPSFGDGGVVQGSTSIGSFSSTEPPSVLVASQSDGTVLTTDGDEVVAFTAAGSPKTQFATGGVFDPRPDIADELIGRLWVDSQDRVIIGYSFIDPQTDSYSGGWVRLEPDGQVDGTFDPTDRDPDFERSTVRPDGRYLGGVRYGGLAQFLPNGDPDPSFGSGGFCCADSAFESPPNAIALSPDGSAYIQAGGCQVRTGPYGGTFCGGAVRKVTPLGTTDATFDVQAASINEAKFSHGLDVDSSGRLLIGKFGKEGANYVPLNDLSVGRFLSNGDPDPTFGDHGIAIAHPAGCSFAFVSDLVATDRGVLASGYACGLPTVVRFTTGDGPSDADADARLDDKDRCRLWPADRHHGCPAVDVSVQVLRNSHRKIVGRVETSDGCSRHLNVRLMAKRPGEDRLVEVISVKRVGWTSNSRLPEGRFYAETKPHYAGERAFCRSDRSPTFSRG